MLKSQSLVSVKLSRNEYDDDSLIFHGILKSYDNSDPMIALFVITDSVNSGLVSKTVYIPLSNIEYITPFTAMDWDLMADEKRFCPSSAVLQERGFSFIKQVTDTKYDFE